jgi:5-methylcytosine-specific restriction endonuclease McrA
MTTLSDATSIDARIAELRREGHSQRVIAEEVGVSASHVGVRLRYLNTVLPEAERLPLHSRRKSSLRSWTDEDLVAAVRDGNSVVDCIRALGLSDKSAKNWTRVRAQIDALGLSTVHWQREATRPGAKIPLSEILVKGSTYATSTLRLRLLSEGVLEHRCASCERTEWLGQPIALELEHINGVSNDHRLDNLKMLCPNCHAQTPTWRGRKNRIHRCVDCEVGISAAAIRCRGCAIKSGYMAPPPPKIEWPDDAAVRELVREHGWAGAGRALGVSDNAVRKRLRRAEKLAAAVEAA